AALLAAAVAARRLGGAGGYGGHMTAAMADGGTVTAIDFNSTAPAAATPEMFAPDAAGKVPAQAMNFGWKAAGVPGTLAGLQRALDRFGSGQFAAVAEPAIRRARDGVPVSQGLA